MKQSIIIPEKICPDVFNLPCVIGVNKSGNKDKSPIYYLSSWYMVDYSQPLLAHPGDILIEEDNGKWRVGEKKG